MKRLDRRNALQLLTGAALLPRELFAARQTRAGAAAGSVLSPADSAFLDDMQRRGCLFFHEQASPHTGQVLDRAAASSQGAVGAIGLLDKRRMASIAATGFGLTALCIADKRGYQPHAQIVEQVRRTLRFHANVLPNDHGFFSHFNDLETGYPYQGSEISSIDTALLMSGIKGKAGAGPE